MGGCVCLCPGRSIQTNLPRISFQSRPSGWPAHRAGLGLCLYYYWSQRVAILHTKILYCLCGAELGVVPDQGGQGLHCAFYGAILFSAITRNLRSADNLISLDLVWVGLRFLQKLVPDLLVPHIDHGEVG